MLNNYYNRDFRDCKAADDFSVELFTLKIILSIAHIVGNNEVINVKSEDY